MTMNKVPHFLPVAGRKIILYFRRTIVKKLNRFQTFILHMRPEEGEHCAYIDFGHIHTRDLIYISKPTALVYVSRPTFRCHFIGTKISADHVGSIQTHFISCMSTY